MRRFIATLAVSLASFAALGAPVAAQSDPVPERRLVTERNVDFFGGDLRSVFDTDIATCRRICLEDPLCAGFTFNTRSNACFPKGTLGERQAFEGAVSARVLATDPAVMRDAPARARDLSFLPARDLATARDMARDLSLRHAADHWTEADFLRAADGARTEGNVTNAIWFISAALTLTDRAALWADLAELALGVRSDNNTTMQQMNNLARSAAINAYLRHRRPDEGAEALLLLADALEKSRRGRLAIPALRLAMELAPSAETEAALDRVIGLYGFRVSEHEVQSDLADPRICVRFSEPLRTSGVEYADYVRLDRGSAAVEAEESQLCVSGLRHGERYTLTLRAGLPSGGSDTLIRPVEIEAYVRDRRPTARFAGRGYILPAMPGASLPIVTVNLTEVDLALYRVDDRNILRALQSRVIGGQLYPYEEERLTGEIGALVWQGTGAVGMELNREVTTRLPIGEVLPVLAPGVYGLSARAPGEDIYSRPAATQWFVVSDLGLASYSGADGMTVVVRSLADASAVEGARLTLVAVNNTPLGEAVTDAEGVARFPAGLLRGRAGSAPGLVTALVEGAEGPRDYTYMSLTDPEFDLSDRGVSGRALRPGLDLFAVTDRGAYRPGERVNATVLVRDGAAEAVTGLPLTAIWTRPDGAEHHRATLGDAGAGGRVASLDVPGGAQRGTWRLALHADPQAPALETLAFLVEDFVPERIDAVLDMPEGPLDPQAMPDIEVSARWLYGAPGAGLQIEGEVTLRTTRMLAAFPGYVFGREVADVWPASRGLAADETDDEGRARIAVLLPEVEAAGRALEMAATVRVREGSGRPVERRLSRAIAPAAPLLGIRPLFEEAAPEGGEAAFHLIATGPGAERLQARWVLDRVETRYQWYEIYGEWRWEPVTTRSRVADGTVTLGGPDPVEVAAAVTWGRFELRVESPERGDVVSTHSFHAGWYVPADTATSPDLLEVGLDRASYSPGDTARLRVVPRHGGLAVVSVLSDRVIDLKVVEVAEGENLIELPVTDDWGPGAYVTASVIRPMDSAAGHNPARAMGLSWARVEPGTRALSARFDMPAEAAPRAALEAVLHVEGVAPGDTAHVTIAAVDLGILNLTGHQPPDPQGHYFGQRRLGVALRDVYGRLIDATAGEMGALRQGGDGAARGRLQAPPPTEDLVAFFSGPLAVGADGTVRTRFDLPAFNGTVRLTAVVWSGRAVGQASADVVVADPIVAVASLPRFVAPGDESRMLLELAHVKGEAGAVGLSLAASPGLDFDAAALPASVTLAEGGRMTLSLPFSATRAGQAEIQLRLVTPGGEVLDRRLSLDVRANDPEIARTTRLSLAPGQSFQLDSAAFTGLVAGTGQATLSAGPLARFDAPGLLAMLDRYPYGCTEQITSQAMPLLYMGALARAMGLDTASDLSARIDGAVTAVLLNQTATGSFGLWSPAFGDFWLDAYVTDFLSRARATGVAVPDLAFRNALANLRNRINYAPDFENGGEDIAYALLVLAREGAAVMGDLRYYADARADAFATPLAQAQLGAALALYGDQRRADAMFARANARLAGEAPVSTAPVWRSDYGTRLRDSAAVLTLAVESGSQAVDRDRLAARLAGASAANRPRSTQEAVWSLLAASALAGDVSASGLIMNGAPMTGPVVHVLADRAGAEPVEWRNESGAAIDLTLTTFGLPAGREPAGGDGYRIERLWYDLQGNEVDPSLVAINTRLVAVIRVTPERGGEARLMVSDPLPAGFEIDNPAFLRAGDVRALDWLDLNAEPVHAEYREDRFLAAVDWRDQGPFQLAYLVRAISPGSFHHPAASVEDMYRPAFRARTASGRVVVEE